MKKLLILGVGEANKLAIECRCGTETILDLLKPISAPDQCPGCGMKWTELVIRKHIESLRIALQALTALSDQERFPAFTFRVIRED